MKKIHTILIGILTLQIVFYVAGYYTQETTEPFKKNSALINFDEFKIDQIQIQDTDAKVKIFKKNNSWVLPDEMDFPASAEKIKNLLIELKNINESWPVGKTTVAAKQFNTSDETFKKKVYLYEKDKIVRTLYFGTSPSFKKVHLRLDDEKNTYAVNFENYKLASSGKNWRDTDVLRLEKQDLNKISLNNFELDHKNDAWRIDEQNESETIVEDKVNELVGKITNLSFDDVLGIEDKKEYGMSKPALEFSVSAKNKDISYKVAGPYEKDFFVMKPSNLPYYFKIGKAQIESIQGLKRESLIQKKEEKTEELN